MSNLHSSKAVKKLFHSVEMSTKFLELIRSDICELNGVVTRDDKRYFITFINDFLKYCYVYLLKLKHEAFTKFVAYKTKVENQLESKIKILRSEARSRSFDLIVGANVPLLF